MNLFEMFFVFLFMLACLGATLGFWMWLYWLWKTEIQPLTYGLVWREAYVKLRYYKDGSTWKTYEHDWVHPKTYKGPVVIDDQDH